MDVLAFNCGSSSLKYKLIAMPEETLLAAGEAQRIGAPTAESPRIVHRSDGRQETHVAEMRDHASAFLKVMGLIAGERRRPPDALGHRMVHGGSRFRAPVAVDDAVLDGLARVRHLAPLHNPPATDLIAACRRRYPRLPQVVVFDTAYHATIPECARTYALPRSLAEKHGLRKYGFHGISHQFVAEEAARLLKKPLAELDAVSCHLGSGGASLCAISKGRSVENTMGYSPLQGLVMSTRSGDLDPAVTLSLLDRAHGDPATVEEMLNQRSGVLGLSGVSADVRDVLGGIEAGRDDRLRLAAQAYLWRIRKYLGAYLALLGRADAVIFTDTVGQEVPEVRQAVCADMGALRLRIDPQQNADVTALPADVATQDSPARILVIRTDEELAIARRTYATLAAMK